MFWNKIKEPEGRCKINTRLINVDMKVLSKLKTNGNKDLSFKGNSVYYKNKKLGDLDDKTVKRLEKTGTDNYYWTVYDITETIETDEKTIDEIIGKGIGIKFY